MKIEDEWPAYRESGSSRRSAVALGVVGLLVYLGVAPVNLARFHPGALQLAVCLLALEVAGAVLYVGGADMTKGRNLDKVAIWACAVVVLWTLPNAAILYNQWAKFTETIKPDV